MGSVYGQAAQVSVFEQSGGSVVSILSYNVTSSENGRTLMIRITNNSPELLSSTVSLPSPSADQQLDSSLRIDGTDVLAISGSASVSRSSDGKVLLGIRNLQFRDGSLVNGDVNGKAPIRNNLINHLKYDWNEQCNSIRHETPHSGC